MKKIGLVDVDGHNFPNLCLMKLSSYHKAKGDSVTWWEKDGHYDLVYASKVFTASSMPEIGNTEHLVVGGSGISTDPGHRLPYEVEHQTPDYSLYPQFDFALGFLTRGCPRVNHSFCITPKKDGCVSIKVADLSEFWTGQKEIYLLDQNLLACKEHRIELLGQLADSGARVEMSGGTDVRYMTDEVINAFKRVRVKDFHFAWDDPRENLLPMFKKVVAADFMRPKDIGVYVLTNYWSTTEEDLARIYALRSLGLSPYVMIYGKMDFVDAHGHWKPDVKDRFTLEQRRHFKVCQHLQRWASPRIINNCPDFNDYERYRKWKEAGCNA